MGPELGDSASFRERVFEKLYTSSSSFVSLNLFPFVALFQFSREESSVIKQ
jgi:hypothetical protein